MLAFDWHSPDRDFSDPYCEYCSEPCGVHREDQGYGVTEFWGARSIDQAMVWVSDCCCEGVAEGPPNDEPEA